MVRHAVLQLSILAYGVFGELSAGIPSNWTRYPAISGTAARGPLKLVDIPPGDALVVMLKPQFRAPTNRLAPEREILEAHNIPYFAKSQSDRLLLTVS